MLICGVFLIELIYGLTSIPLNCDYMRTECWNSLFFSFNQTPEEAGAPAAQSGIDDAANELHSAPMKSSMSHLLPPFPLRWERKKSSHNVECSLL